MSIKITELTPFVFEDGNIYYFQIIKNDFSNSYHYLYVYEKKKFTKTIWFRKKSFEKYVQIGKEELIKINFDVDDLKSEICEVIRSTKPKVVDGWDGFVGDIPDDLKKAFIRSSKIEDLFSE